MNEAEALTSLAASVEKLAAALSQEHPYTIPGASDWPLLVACAAVAGVLLGLVYTGLSRKMDDIVGTIKEEKTSCASCEASIWNAIDDCCPRGGRRKGDK